MNFIPFFFLGYVLGKNEKRGCTSDEDSLITLDSLSTLSFLLCTAAISAFAAFVAMPIRAGIDGPQLTVAMSVLSVFTPLISIFGAGLVYEFWKTHAGEITQQAEMLALGTASGLTLIAFALRVSGLMSGLSPDKWLLLRALPALSIPLLLIICDSLIKRRQLKHL